VYAPIAQEPETRYGLVVRTVDERLALQPAIEAAVRALDPDLPLFEARTMRRRLDLSIARERMAMIVLLVFAGVAVTLASVGLYGVVSHSVTERTHEIGVRMALGAEAAHIVALVVRQGMTTAVAGTAIGIAAAASLSRAIQDLLFGVTPTDPLTFGGVVVLLLTVALVACYVPARRATRVDPTTALRAE